MNYYYLLQPFGQIRTAVFLGDNNFFIPLYRLDTFQIVF